MSTLRGEVEGLIAGWLNMASRFKTYGRDGEDRAARLELCAEEARRVLARHPSTEPADGVVVPRDLLKSLSACAAEHSKELAFIIRNDDDPSFVQEKIEVDALIEQADAILADDDGGVIKSHKRPSAAPCMER